MVRALVSTPGSVGGMVGLVVVTLTVTPISVFLRAAHL